MKTWVTAFLVTFMMSSSWAGLGNAPAHFGPGAKPAQARAASTGAATYTDLERTLDSGTTVHEYVDASGVVFAVSWSGPYLPDLKEILGDAPFDKMVSQANRMPKGGRSPLVLKRRDLVVESGGHMGAFQGRAWLPDQLPPGFKPGDIQ